MNLFARFAQDESGATAIEYGLIAALISVGIIVAATLLSAATLPTSSPVSRTSLTNRDALIGKRRHRRDPSGIAEVDSSTKGAAPAAPFFRFLKRLTLGKFCPISEKLGPMPIGHVYHRTAAISGRHGTGGIIRPAHHEDLQQAGAVADGGVSSASPLPCNCPSQSARHARPVRAGCAGRGLHPVSPWVWIGGGDAKLAAATALWLGFGLA